MGTVNYVLKGGEQFNMVLLVPDDIPEGGATTVEGNVEEMRALYKDWDPRYLSFPAVRTGLTFQNPKTAQALRAGPQVEAVHQRGPGQMVPPLRNLRPPRRRRARHAPVPCIGRWNVPRRRSSPRRMPRPDQVQG